MGLLSRADGVLGTGARDEEDTPQLPVACQGLVKEKDRRDAEKEQAVGHTGTERAPRAEAGRRRCCAPGPLDSLRGSSDLARKNAQLAQ